MSLSSNFFTEKPSCHLSIVIPIAMSTEFDKGLEISEILNLQPKVSWRRKKNLCWRWRERRKNSSIEEKNSKQTLPDFIGTAGVAGDNQNSTASQTLVSEL